MKAASCTGIRPVRTQNQASTAGPQSNFPFSKSGEITTEVARTYGIAMQALKQKVNIQPGETLVVLSGDCPIGLAVVELGALLGARVIAVCSTDETCEVAWSAGAHDIVSMADGPLVTAIEALTASQGITIVFSSRPTAKIRDIAPFLKARSSVFVASEMPWDVPPNKEHYAQMSKWYQQGLLLPQDAKPNSAMHS